MDHLRTQNLPPLPIHNFPMAVHGGRPGQLSMMSEPGRDGALLSPHQSNMSMGMDLRRPASTEAFRSGERQYRSPSSLVFDTSRSPSTTSLAPPSQRSSQFSNAPSRWGSQSQPTDDLDEEEDDEADERQAGPPVPTKSVLAATMRTKVFLKQAHAQWKALGTAKLMVFVQTPGNVKQLVVEEDKVKGKTLISTIVLTDGVERVGRTGVAVDLSDNGARTGIVYMLQVRT